MIDTSGRLWVTDFGLAQMQSETRLTATGDLVGTLRYRSPEQALAKRVVIDHRSDIYSLGATLYELLTLQSPITGEDRQELLRQIAFEEPPRPRRVNRGIPAELETIVLKALEKNPNDRYATAQELADDLRCWLKDKPIRARRVGRLERAWRWCRRNHVVAGLLTLVALLLVAGTSVSTLLAVVAAEHARVADVKAKDAEESARKARQAERLANRRAYGSAMLLTQAAWEQNHVERFLQLLEEQKPRTPNDEDLRGFEWFYWKRQFQRGHATFKGHTYWAPAWRSPPTASGSCRGAMTRR
jgi:hypothetical protein